jgi:hypothetical protein
LVVSVKKFGTEAALVGALAFTALGISTGAANAEQSVPATPGVTWKLDNNWDDGDDNDEWRAPGWDVPNYWEVPQYGACAWVPPALSMWVPPAAC